MISVGNAKRSARINQPLRNTWNTIIAEFILYFVCKSVKISKFTIFTSLHPSERTNQVLVQLNYNSALLQCFLQWCFHENNVPFGGFNKPLTAAFDFIIKKQKKKYKRLFSNGLKVVWKVVEIKTKWFCDVIMLNMWFLWRLSCQDSTSTLLFQTPRVLNYLNSWIMTIHYSMMTPEIEFLNSSLNVWLLKSCQGKITFKQTRISSRGWFSQPGTIKGIKTSFNKSV